jgi:hypothetical protein
MSTKTPRRLCGGLSFVAPLAGPGKIDPPKRQRQSHEASEREGSEKDPEHCSRTLSLAGFGSGQPAPQLSLSFTSSGNAGINAGEGFSIKDGAFAPLENVEEVEKNDD